ncbi:MAG: hypothetical protein IPG06_02855 [Haliea sp.]|nr:hypothetical protein [Haliea sp.]
MLVYAHGGLNSEDASIERNQVLGKVFADNTVYPLFTTWKSGPVEPSPTYSAIQGPWRTQRPPPVADLEPTDRLLESACRHLLVKAMDRNEGKRGTRTAERTRYQALPKL